jgi:D-arabinose 5-phosphate isomerase GutQ
MAGGAGEELLARARQVVAREARGVAGLAAQLDEHLIEVVDLLYACQGHVLVAGAGTSHAVAQRLAHLLSCSGTPALCVNAADALHGGAGAVTDRDVVYFISKGGRSAEINRFAEIARARGAKIVVQTEDLESPLAKMAHAVYPVRAEGEAGPRDEIDPGGGIDPGDEIDPYGMIATGSSLVNAAAGDVLCVLLLERRGYTREAFGQTHPGGAVGEKLKGQG